MNLPLSLCHNCFLRAQYVPARKTCLLPENERHQKPRRVLLNYLWLHSPPPLLLRDAVSTLGCISTRVEKRQTGSPWPIQLTITVCVGYTGHLPRCFSNRAVLLHTAVFIKIRKIRQRIKSKRCFQGNGTEHTLGPVFCFFFKHIPCLTCIAVELVMPLSIG